MTDDNIRDACEQHGARRVYDAAYERVVGNHKALCAVGLPRIVDLGEAHTIARIAYSILRVDNETVSRGPGNRSDRQ